MMDLTKRAEAAIREAYQPDGIQSGNESGTGSRRRNCGPHSYAHAAALEWGYQLHDDGGRNTSSAGRSADDLCEASRPVLAD